MQRRPRCVQHWSNPQNAAEPLQAVSDAEDLEFEEVGSDITAAPESPAACDQQVNQAELPPQANLVRHPLRSVGVYEPWPSFNRTDSRLGALRHHDLLPENWLSLVFGAAWVDRSFSRELQRRACTHRRSSPCRCYPKYPVFNSRTSPLTLRPSRSP